MGEEQESGERKVRKMVGAEQLRRLHVLHKDFADVIRNTPGRMNLVVHTIETVHQQGYCPINCHIAIGIQ